MVFGPRKVMFALMLSSAMDNVLVENDQIKHQSSILDIRACFAYNSTHLIKFLKN